MRAGGKMLKRFDKAIKEDFYCPEIEYCGKKRFPAESYGARFAAKEASLRLSVPVGARLKAQSGKR